MTDNNASNTGYIKYFLYLIVLFAFFTYLHDVIKAIFTSDLIDLRHYYVNSKLLLRGVDPWIISPQEYLTYAKSLIPKAGYNAYAAILHSPGFFLIFSPFTLLGFSGSSVLWVLTCQAALFISVWLILTKIIDNPYTPKVLTGLFLFFIFWPLREDFFIGQPNSLILLFFTLSILCFINKRIFLAGIFLGLGIQIKELFIPVLLFCLPKSHWRALAGAIGVILLLKLAAILSFGMDKEISYWQYQFGFFSPQLAAKGFTDISGLSLIYILRNFSQGLINIKLIDLAVILIALFVLIRAFRVLSDINTKPDSDRLVLVFSFFITLCFMVCPWVHETHLVVLILPILTCWFYILKEPVKKSSMVCFISAFLILGLKYSVTGFPQTWAGPFAFLLSFKGLGYVLLFLLLDNLLRAKDER